MYAKLRLPPQNRSFSRCILRQTAILAGPNGRIEPNYFLYRDASFLGPEKSCVFVGSPGCVRLVRAARDRLYDQKIDSYEKKSGIRESRVRRRFGESRVRRRKPGIRLTRDSRVSVVSLEIPGFPSSHSRFPHSDASTSLSDADAWLSDAWFTMQTEPPPTDAPYFKNP